jgi:hypothetical protein
MILPNLHFMKIRGEGLIGDIVEARCFNKNE